MKAWIPRISRPSGATSRLSGDIRTFPGSNKFRSTAVVHQPLQRNHHGPEDSQISSLAKVNSVRYYFSLAEKIREMLPSNVFEENGKDLDDGLELQPELERDLEDWNAHRSLAAYESEIYIAEKLAKQLAYRDLVTFIVESIPLQAALSALVERITPIIREGPLGELGVVELAYHLHSESNHGLAQHYLQAVGISGSIWPFELVSILDDSNTQLSTRELTFPAVTTEKVDGVLNSLRPNLHFPQLLSQPRLPGTDFTVFIWLKARALTMLPWAECEKWLKRYSIRLAQHSLSDCLTQSHLVAFMGQQVAEFGMFAKWASMDRSNIVPLISITKTPAELHTILRPMLRPTKVDEVENETAVALLRAALRQKQSYDIANICRSFNKLLIETKPKQALLADALLAVAFAQKKYTTTEDGSFDGKSEDITMPLHSLRTPLARMVLPSDPNIASVVVGDAAWKLQARYRQRRVPGRVLWQLLSSLPHGLSLSGYAQSELAKLVVLRPYVEQVRFMALPFVTKRGLEQLLQWHVNKIIDYRRRNKVSWNTLQAKEDVQLLIIGAAMAAEKTEKKGLKKGGLHTLIISKFESEKEAKSEMSANEDHELIDLLVEDATTVSAWLILDITAELIMNKNYAVAQQMLRMLGPRLSMVSFDTILLELAETHPAECYYFVLWLLTEGLPTRPVTFVTLDRLLLVLIKESSLSESQIMNRFQTLRGLIGKRMRREVSIESAATFVDALIESSKLRNAGSRQRLKWALEIAHKAGVPDIYFENWTSELQKMNANKIGFWYGTQ